MYIVLVVFTPDEVTIWEAIITLLSFPVLVVNSYMAEMNFFLKPSKEDLEEVLNLSEMCKITDLNFKKKKSNHLFIDLKAVWQRKKLFEDPMVSAEEVLKYTKVKEALFLFKLKAICMTNKNNKSIKEIGVRDDLTEDEKAKLMAAKILKSKEKSRIHYRINGVREITGGRKNEIELPSHLEKVLFITILIYSLFD